MNFGGGRELGPMIGVLRMIATMFRGWGRFEGTFARSGSERLTLTL